MSRQVKVRSRWVLLSLLALGLAAACGSSSNDVSTGQEAGGPPSSLPGEFGSTEGAYPYLTADDRQLYGVAYDTADGSLGAAIHLDTGEMSELPNPVEGPFVVQSAMAASSGGLRVIGVRCSSLPLDDNDPEACRDQSESYSFSAATRQWSALTVPDGFHFGEFVAGGGERPDVAVFRHAADPAVATVATADERGWHPSADLTVGDTRNQWCATADTVFHLGVTATGEFGSPGEGYDAEPTVAFSLTQVTLDGETSGLPVPDLFPFFGGVGANLGCAGDTVYLVSNQGRGLPPFTYVLRDGQWVSLDPGVSGGLPAAAGAALSGPVALFSWSATPSPDGEPTPEVGQRTTVALTPSGPGQVVIEPDAGDVKPVWRGQTNVVLLIGPRSTPDPNDPGGAIPASAVGLRMVEVER